MRDYKHLERDLARIYHAPTETRNDGWSSTFWHFLETVMTWLAFFWLGVAALWVIGVMLGFCFEGITIGFEIGRGWARWLWEIPR